MWNLKVLQMTQFQVNDILSFTNKFNYTTTLIITRITEKSVFVMWYNNGKPFHEHRMSFNSLKDYKKIN